MLLSDLSPASRQCVQAHLLKKDLQDVYCNATARTISIASDLHKMTLSVGLQKKPMKQLSLEAFLKLKKANNLSKKTAHGGWYLAAS